MKHVNRFVLITATVFSIFSCKKDNSGSGDQITPPASKDFAAIRGHALDTRIQKFKVSTDAPIEITSSNGTRVNIVPGSLKIKGAPVTGEINIEFLELYKAGDMLVTNKRTMGENGDGKRSMIISGGSFYLNAFQNGIELDRGAIINMLVPGDLTGGADNEMTLWDGGLDEDGNLTWTPVEAGTGDGQNKNRIFVEGKSYYAQFSNFGWTNIDKFYSDPREKTILWVKAPAGFDGKNSAVYLKYKGEPNALASLDVFDADKQLFSEHYGQIPIGIECHLIFVTESNNNWRVAVKSVTIEKDKIYEFNISDTQVVTESAMVEMVNNLP
ncbi:MAG: hypothetical protein JST63_04945 [Bacteroidetes bacterium]|nr:hypothetical protein [Bacteroidota bacterium]